MLNSTPSKNRSPIQPHRRPTLFRAPNVFQCSSRQLPPPSSVHVWRAAEGLLLLLGGGREGGREGGTIGGAMNFIMQGPSGTAARNVATVHTLMHQSRKLLHYQSILIMCEYSILEHEGMNGVCSVPLHSANMAMRTLMTVTKIGGVARDCPSGVRIAVREGRKILFVCDCEAPRARARARSQIVGGDTGNNYAGQGISDDWQSTGGTPFEQSEVTMVSRVKRRLR